MSPMLAVQAQRGHVQRMRLTIAGVEIAVDLAEAAGAELLRDRFGAKAPAAGARPIDAAITLSTVPALLHPECGDGDGLQVEAGARGRLRLWRQDLDVEWDPGAAHLRASACGESGSLASVLRIACALALPRRGGLLLHASSVVGARGAILFPGASGAGKTTLARLADQRDVLSDEISAVRWLDGAYLCHPTPFWGELGERRPGRPARLRALGLPSRAPCAGLRPVSRAHALERLLTCALAFVERPAERLKVVDVAVQLAERVPAFEVRFALNDSPWSLLDELDPLPTAN